MYKIDARLILPLRTKDPRQDGSNHHEDEADD